MPAPDKLWDAATAMYKTYPWVFDLRLSGILETLEVRNRQAIEDKLSFVDSAALDRLASP